MAPNVNDLIKAGNNAAAKQQATIDAARETAQQVAASRPNPKPATVAPATGAAAPAGGAQ